MADKKISALTAATTPLDGTEVLPIVQSGATKKVANNDLRPRQIQSNATSGVLQIVGPAAAATRVMTTPDANFTAARTDAANSFSGNQTLSDGNLVLGTAGKGVTTGGATALGLGVNNAVDAVTIDTSKNVGVGTTTPTSGSLSNSAIVNAGVFSTLRGSVASTSGVTVTLATANQNYPLATYIVSCGISSGAPTVYSAVAIVSADNNVLRITNLQTASLMTLSVSGTDIRATQSSGGPANILFAITRIA